MIIISGRYKMFILIKMSSEIDYFSIGVVSAIVVLIIKSSSVY